MKKTADIQKKIIRTILAAAAVLSCTVLPQSPAHQPQADAVQAAADPYAKKASITEEMTSKRTKFTKEFVMSDGSFTAAAYSMPVHYKKSKNGGWKEINTTLVKSGRKKYRTKATDLGIRVSKKANKKSVISLKRGRSGVSIALKGRKLKSIKAKITNPKKKTKTDVRSQSTVLYKNVLKNINVSYDIFPEKIQEIVTIKKKQKNRTLSFKIDAGKLKVKTKGKKVTFKTKKGKTPFTRLGTVFTDAHGVSSAKAKITYHKKTKTLKVTPDKKWWNSKKRKFPLEVRTTYVTEKHERDVRIGAAYAGAPGSSFRYDKSLLIQPGKCVSFVKMDPLSALKNKNAQILSAALHIKNKRTMKLGAGKTFDIGIHKVTEKWTPKKLTYNNRPAYESDSSATVRLQKKGNYLCDVTSILKAWQAGEANQGVAIVADNTNRSYRAELDRNPYFTVHYETVGFEGAVELKEDHPVTRDVQKAGQENYYYFDARPGIAYDLYTESSADTQGTLYDRDKKRTGYDDNSGLQKNFLITRSYHGRTYLKVSLKNKATGTYTLHLKKRFAVPELSGTCGQDRYLLTWNAVKNAGEYLVSVYDGGKKISETIAKETSCEYIYTSETRGKILGFTVTARKNASLTGEPSRMVYNTDSRSEWVYTTPMPEKRKNSSVVTLDQRIYVLGGESEGRPIKSFAAYDMEKKRWEPLPDYPGTDSGICKTVMTAYNKEILVIGGQTGTSTGAKTLSSVYSFNTETKRWQKKAEMKEGRTNLAAALSGDTLCAWSRAGKTNKTDIYHIKTDTWETAVQPDTSTIIHATSVDQRIFVLKEDGEKMYWQEYLPEDNAYEEAGMPCPYAVSDEYSVSAVIRGKIYMAKEKSTKEILVYDAYAGEWSRISDMNLTKKGSVLAACGNDLYSIGGEMAGFGMLDVVEQYTVKVQAAVKDIVVKKGEVCELQVTAGNLKKGKTKIVTVKVDPRELQIQSASSFEENEALKEGTDGVTLLQYQPKKGVMVLKMEGSLERGQSYETYQSIPVEAKADGKTKVEITLTEKQGE